MCWKSKHKPKLEIAEEDIPVQKVLDVTVGYEPCSPIYPFKWKLNNKYFVQLPIPIFDDKLKCWQAHIGFHSCGSIHVIDYNFARQCKNKFGVTVLATSNFRYDNWKVFNCIIPKGTKYYKNEYDDYISNALIILKEEEWDYDKRKVR